MKNTARLLLVIFAICFAVGSVPIAMAANHDAPFLDVASDDWFCDAVAYVYTNGIMAGTGNDTFSPYTPTTRGMIVTMLHRMEGCPYSPGSVFFDVSADAYYADAVAWASNEGIITGYGDGYFGPNDLITKEQFAAILYRYAAYCNFDTESNMDLSEYTDMASISSYAVDAMCWSCEIGLLVGSEGKLNPLAPATRAEAAAILMRYDGFVLSEILFGDETGDKTDEDESTRPAWNPAGKTVPIMVPSTQDAMEISFGQYDSNGNLIREFSGLIYNSSGYEINSFEYEDGLLTSNSIYQGILRTIDGYPGVDETDCTYLSEQSFVVERYGQDGEKTEFTIRYEGDTMIIDSDSYKLRSFVEQIIAAIRPADVTQVLVNTTVLVREDMYTDYVPGRYPVTYEYGFDSNGNLIEVKINEIKVSSFQYDDLGYLISCESLFFSESPTYKNIPKKEDAENSSSNVSSDINGWAQYSVDSILACTYEYNENGQMTACVCTAEENGISSDYVYGFTYHETGDLDKIILFWDDDSTLTYTVSYDENSDLSLLPDYNAVWS